MKKFFKKAFMVLGIMGMGLTTTSCDSEVVKEIIKNIDWSALLSEMVGNLFNGGTTNVYQGNYSLQHLVSDGKGAYTLESEKLEFAGTGVTVTKNRDNSINIILPGTDGIGDATMTDVNVQNLQFVTDEKTGTVTNTVDLGENSYIDGTLTVGGKEYAASNLYIVCTLTEGQMVIKEASIYFGNNAEQAINVTFSGKIVEEAAQ